LNKLLPLDREKAARLTFGFALLILADRYSTHTLVHQLQNPVLFVTEFDYTYWVYHFIRFPEIFVQNRTGAIVFDSVLVFSTVWNLFTAANNRIIVLICAVSWTLYGITYNSYDCHLQHNISGIMLFPYVFLAKKERDFNMVWEGARYFCLFVYADAFLYKAVIAGNLYYFPMGVEIIKTNQAQFMLQNPASALTRFYTFFITHPGLSYAGFVVMVILQGGMGVGFFTKKWDKFLFFIPIIFHAVNYIFVDVNFFELLVLNITLLPFRPAAYARGQDSVSSASQLSASERGPEIQTASPSGK
jgi:hypothetical protein